MLRSNANPIAVVTTSWDDGDPLDLKLAEVLSEYDIPGTFYLAPRNQERAVLSGSEMRDLAAVFEIGSHSLTHPVLPNLTDEQLAEEVEGSKHVLESVLGKPIRMFAYPRGIYSSRVKTAVRDAGYAGARTIREAGIRSPRDRFAMCTSLSAYPHSWWMRLRHALRTADLQDVLLLYRIGVGRGWVHWSRVLFEGALRTGGVWHLWGHSWEIDQLDLWDDLRAVLGTVAGHPNVSYLTNTGVIESESRL